MNENYDIWLVIRARAVENKFHGWITFIDITSFHNRREARECKLSFVYDDIYRFWQFRKRKKRRQHRAHRSFPVSFLYCHRILCLPTLEFSIRKKQTRNAIQKKGDKLNRRKDKECKNIPIFKRRQQRRLHLILCI